MTTRHTDSMAQLTKSINGIGEAFDLFKKAQDERFDNMQDRIEEIESLGNRPGRTSGEQSAAAEHKARFINWLRKPKSAETKMALEAIEQKAVSIGTAALGGFALPEEIAREIERLELRFSPVRSLVKVVRTSTSDFKHLVNLRGAGAAWVGETGARSETATPALRERATTHGELYAYPQATNWSLDDLFFDVAAWLAEEVAQQFAVEEGSAVITGNGTSKPTGMLNTAPTLDADFASPLRNASAYQFIPSFTSPLGILPDTLIDLVYAVNSMYRSNATWAMNSTTAATVRKLKDAQNQYLWQPGLIEGQPDRLLGYPVAIWEQMQNVGPNQHPIAFGDFRRGYIINDIGVMKITVDEVTTPGFTKFYVRRREGGIVLNNDAIKFLKTT